MPMRVVTAIGCSAHTGYGDDPAGQRSTYTKVMWGTFIPAGLLGALASYLRLRYFMTTVLQRFKWVVLESVHPEEPGVALENCLHTESRIPCF
jgi:hypothetical protein